MERLTGDELKVPPREELLARREGLLQRFSMEKLESAHASGNQRLAEKKEIETRRGASSHSFDAIHQTFDGLFRELINNFKALDAMPASISDQELLRLCNQADPAAFLNARQDNYDKDRHIISSRLRDLKLALVSIAGALSLTPQEIEITFSQGKSR